MTTDGLKLRTSGDAYEILVLAQGSLGSGPMRLGAKGRCRYCGETDPRKFRSVAHAVPESLGNKWIVSLDECDDCNAVFSRYEDSLAKTIGPVLTLGGTPGKDNAVRQTGRSAGPAVIRHEHSESGRRLSIQVTGEFGDHLSVDPAKGTLAFKIPIANERFIPRRAYKALVRMGLAAMPVAELANFQSLLAWVRDLDDEVTMPPLLVGLSIGSLGNAPRIASITLLRRKPEAPSTSPYMVLIMTAGSACFQLDLKADALDGPWPPTRPVNIGIRWTSVLGGGDGPDISIPYGVPATLDWSSSEPRLQPFETLITEVDRNGDGTLTLAFREDALVLAR